MIKQKKWGNTGIQVSELALGCLGFGTKNSQKISYELLDYYTDQGGNFLDTANNYAFWEEGAQGGESEILLGNWMKERKNRDKIFLSTKVGGFPRDLQKLRDNSGTREGWLKYAEGLSSQSIKKAVDKSLERLQTDYIDVYHAHIDDSITDLTETLRAFHDLVKSGKVRSISCSNYSLRRLKEGLAISQEKGWTSYSAVQNFYTYLRPKSGADWGIQAVPDESLMDFCRKREDLIFMAYTPLLWGAYTERSRLKDIPRLGDFISPQNQSRLAALDKVAKDTGASVNQIVYKWMMQTNPRLIPLVAVSSMSHLKENLATCALELTAEQIQWLNHPRV